jgi:hypothetical protein
MQAAPANPADELQQSQPTAALAAAAAAAQHAMINRRRGRKISEETMLSSMKGLD